MPQAIPAAFAFVSNVVGQVAFLAKTATGLSAATFAAGVKVLTLAGVNAFISSQRGSFVPQGSFLELGLAADQPRRIQVGRRANAGVLVDHFSSGNKNQFLYLVIYLGEGPMQPLSEIWADGRLVYDGSIAHGVTTTLTEFNSPDPRCWVTYYDGRNGQTAPSELVSSGFVNSNFVGNGCAYVVVKLHWDPDTTAAIPQFLFVSDGAKLYDRRQDGTAGGTGSQRWGDPSTWQVSDNPAVALDHYLLGRQWSGDDKPRMGIGLSAADVPYDRFNALASLCEENVSLSIGGNQQRYKANGFILSDQQHADVITELCQAMDARPADFGGKVSAISHESKTPVLTINDADRAEGVPERYRPKRSWSSLVGGVSGTYQDPLNLFRPSEYPRVEDAAWATEDGGETRSAVVNFPFETNAERAQRLARLFVQRERRQATLTGTYAPKTIELEEGDWFTRVGGKFGAGKTFEVVAPPVLDPRSMAVLIQAVEVDASNSAWSSSSAEETNAPAGDSLKTPPRLPIPNVTFATFQYNKSSYSFPSIRFNHTEFDDGFGVGVEIELTDSDGAGAPAVGGEVQVFEIAPGVQYRSVINALLPDETYVVRVRAKLGQDVSLWSSYSEFTSGASAQYGAIGGGDAVLGSNVYRADGTTLVGDADVITEQGTAAAITGQGALATQDVASSSLAIRINELIDGSANQGEASIMGVTNGARDNTKDGEVLYNGAARTIKRNSQSNLLNATLLTGLANQRGWILYDLQERGTFSPGGHAVDCIFAWRDGQTGQWYYDNNGTATTWTPDASWIVIGRLATAASDVIATADVWSTGYDYSAVEYFEDGADPTGSNTAAAITGQGSLATRNSADWETVFDQSQSLIPNGQLAAIDDSGLPAGFSFVEDIGDRSQLQFLGAGLGVRLLAGPDASVAYGFPAIPIDDRKVYSLTVRHRSAGASASGLYIRFNQLNGSLPDGAKRVGNSDTGSPEVVHRTNIVDVVANGAMPGSAEREDTYTYTPTPGTKFASLGFYNWDGSSVNYDLRWAQLSEQGNHDVGADVTDQNTAAAISGQGNQATADATNGNTASRPSSPPDNSFYCDTEAGVLYFYPNSGTGWIEVANFTVGGGQALSGEYSPSLLLANGGGGVNATAETVNVTVTASGGASPYSFAFSVLSGLNMSVVNTLDDNVKRFRTTGMAVSEFRQGLFRGRITDDDGAVFDVLIGVDFINESFGP